MFQQPWAMLIMKYDTEVHCSGSLISNKFGLSAAHCFSKDVPALKYVPQKNLSLFFGVSDVDHVKGGLPLWETYHIERRLIKDVHTHSQYEYPKIYHDLSIIGEHYVSTTSKIII